MSTPTKENDDGMTTGTNTAAVAAVDVVASTRVKTPSSVRRATAVDVVFKLNV
jgi:cobalamin biosynthesis protein CbiD